MYAQEKKKEKATWYFLKDIILFYFFPFFFLFLYAIPSFFYFLLFSFFFVFYLCFCLVDFPNYVFLFYFYFLFFQPTRVSVVMMNVKVGCSQATEVVGFFLWFQFFQEKKWKVPPFHSLSTFSLPLFLWFVAVWWWYWICDF